MLVWWKFSWPSAQEFPNGLWQGCPSATRTPSNGDVWGKCPKEGTRTGALSSNGMKMVGTITACIRLPLRPPFPDTLPGCSASSSPRPGNMSPQAWPGQKPGGEDTDTYLNEQSMTEDWTSVRCRTTSGEHEWLLFRVSKTWVPNRCLRDQFCSMRDWAMSDGRFQGSWSQEGKPQHSLKIVENRESFVEILSLFH